MSLTYSLSSRHILGPTTVAAPLANLKAKCPGGHDLDNPHLNLTGFIAENKKKKKNCVFDMPTNRWQNVD